MVSAVKKIKAEKKKLWFPAKKYGFGWGLPIAWQGWVVLISYLLLIFIGSAALTNSAINIIWFLSYALILTALFIFICWKKGKKTGLRWGNKK